MNSSIEYIANFKTSLDPYNGITILSEDLPKDILEFEQNAKIGLNRTTMQELDRTQKRSLTGQ